MIKSRELFQYKTNGKKFYCQNLSIHRLYEKGTYMEVVGVTRKLCVGVCMSVWILQETIQLTIRVSSHSY